MSYSDKKNMGCSLIILDFIPFLFLTLQAVTLFCYICLIRLKSLNHWLLAHKSNLGLNPLQISWHLLGHNIVFSFLITALKMSISLVSLVSKLGMLPREEDSSRATWQCPLCPHTPRRHIPRELILFIYSLEV